MVHLIALFKATENGNSVLLRRLLHQHLLKAPLKSSVFFDKLAVFIQRSGAHTMELTPSQRRLEHIARIHSALSFTCTHHGMDFINKQNNLPFLLGQILQYGL